MLNAGRLAACTGSTLAILALTSVACAQSAELPSASILTTQLTDVDPGEGAGFDRTLRARIDALGVVRTEGAVALDLEQIQLALGCMGETAECLSSVATETGTQIIVVPSLVHTGATVLATVLVFDARDQSLRHATREAPTGDAGALFASVNGLVREVFGLPPEPELDHTGAPPSTAGLSPLPFVTIGIGAAALIAGAIAGGLSIGDANTFRAAPHDTMDQVNAALDGVLSRQRAEAIAADVLLIAGGVIVAAGIIWELVAGREDGSSPLALAPMVSSTQVGLALSGCFGGAL